ncbi:MAG TPA: 4-(cytidine 5'-diphospho)-2-C-methyl-D-erythritol kinase [Streptosporangiaceae bacterium]
MTAAVNVRVPAKVNLQLSVGPPRDDGYHDLVNVFHAVSLFDGVTVSPAPELGVIVAGESGVDLDKVPVGPDNLAAQAAAMLAARIGVEPAVRIRIHKAIPVAGGMAGGSADAAATLVACDALWNAGLGEAELFELAAALGSDVPFALMGGTAMGLGRGERLSRVRTRGRYDWVFAIADGGLSTAEVYAECDRLRAAAGERVAAPRAADALLAALAAGDVRTLGRELRNDLQPAALTLRPSLGAVLAAGREAGAIGALVSGSGPTCAFLAESEHQAVDLMTTLSGRGVARSVIRAYGPVPGATLL